MRQVGAIDAWSDWLVVVEYVIDNTPGSHEYSPRDLERSWSLSLPLEKDVLRDALQFEPISDWARGQFKQFKELSDAVKTNWEKASASRARLANRHRRTVDLKVGDRVVWNSGLTGPWRVAEVHGHRLFLGTPVEPKLSLSAWKHMLRTVFWFHQMLKQVWTHCFR